jgi:hypothetical protein
MGLWGSFVVARTPGSLLDLSAVADRSQGLAGEDRYGAWVVGLFPGDELAGQEPELHEELAAETDAPALTAFVLDSDAAVVEAWSPVGGFWRACLDRVSTQKYFGDPDSFGALFLSGEQACGKAVRWAQEAGLEPDERALSYLFTHAQADPFVEGLVRTLVEQLGIPEAWADQVPVDQVPVDQVPVDQVPVDQVPVEQRPLTIAPVHRPGPDGGPRERNPLDDVLARQLTPLLLAAGFVGTGREYRRLNAHGDAVTLFVERGLAWVEGKVTFAVSGFLTPSALTDWRRDHPNDRGELFPRLRIEIHPPQEVAADPSERGHTPSGTWAVDPQDAATGAVIEEFVRDVLIPRAEALLDPRIAADLLTDRRYPAPADRAPERFAFVLDLGPSAALVRDWEAIAESAPWLGPKVHAWAEQRLRTRFGVGPDWRDRLDPSDAAGTPAARLAALSWRHLAPVLAAEGFGVEDGEFRRTNVFRRTNDLGDQLVVQPVLAHCAGGDDLVFSIEASVTPATELRRRRGDVGDEPLPRVTEAASGWCWRRVVPVAPFTHAPTHVPLSLDLWHPRPEDDDACGAAAAEAVRAVLPDLSELLDRDRLLALITDPEPPAGVALGIDRTYRGEIVLRLGRSPAPVVAALIDDLEADFFGRKEKEFIAWARAVLARADG